MSPEEFATEHSLSVEEAYIILERRRLAKTDVGTVRDARLAAAFATLSAAQKKTGVRRVTEVGGILKKETE